MLLSTADITSIDSEFVKVKKIWVNLRKAAKDASGMIRDATGNNVEWLEEELGWEEDSPALLELLKVTAIARLPAKRKA